MNKAQGYERIGRFFVHFAEMESSAERALVAAFKLTDNPAAPVLHFIDIAKKLDLLKAAIGGSRYLSGRETTEAWRKNALQLVKGAYDVNNLRREMAHRSLVVSESGDVEITTRGQPMRLTGTDFNRHFEKLQSLTRAFGGMAFELEGVGLLAETGIFSISVHPTASAGTSPTWTRGQ